MQKILLAGATGYLGGHIAQALSRRSYTCRAIARNPAKLDGLDIPTQEVVQAELTDPDALIGCCEGIDVVISTVGITRQRDGLTYMDVDFQANMNLLREAKKSQVKKFLYVSVLNGPQLRHLKICEAKERFVDELQRSGIDYCVLRPNGFFQDMSEFLQMARKGRAYTLGNGGFRSNPIDGADLAAVCLDAMSGAERELDIGGPQILTQDEIATRAFAALQRKPKITHVPLWLTRPVLSALRALTPSRIHGPIEFFMTVMAMDMIAPAYGTRTLDEYFAGLQADHPASRS